MAKKLLNNPIGAVAQVITVEVVPEDIQKKVEQLEAELVLERAKPPLVQEKVVEITKLVDNPRLIEKIAKLESQYEELKAKGAYKLLKNHIDLVDSRPNIEPVTAANANPSRGRDCKHIAVASIVSLLLGVGLTWLFMR